MNKRKLLLVALSLCMVAILAMGGTLAYLQDTDVARNVFVVGDIDITLWEQERADVKDPSKGVQNFTDDKILLPLVGSAQGGTVAVENTTCGTVNLPDYNNAKNWVDKIVTVQNTSSSQQPAYVRVVFAFPAALDDAKTAAEMLMHWNHDGKEPAGLWNRVDNGQTVVLKGITYNLYTYTYLEILKHGDVTKSPAITGVYIDSRVDATTAENGDITYSFTGKDGTEKKMTFPAGTGPDLYVVAQGVQSAGFEDVGAIAALNEAFGEVTTANAQAWFDAVAADAD